MGMTAQQKILYVANKLGLTSLKNMQASTRAVYDEAPAASDNVILFEGAAQRTFPATNLGANGNRFQVDEALLVEKIGFFIVTDEAIGAYEGLGPSATGVKFDLIIGNKTVIKDFVVEPGGQQAFFNDGNQGSSVVDLEAVGILIPPQVEFKVVAKPMNANTRAARPTQIGCYLFGTGVLLNFNTSI